MKLLIFLFGGAIASLTIVGMLPSSVYVALAMLFITLIFLGAANGALFQVIPVRFPKEVGLLTGFVGAAGGVGGFFLPNILGLFKQLTNTYSLGFWWVAITMLVSVFFMVKIYRLEKREASTSKYVKTINS
jgi:NNP family nitrate/nitrite transporter-like MFS transporter